MMSEQDPDHEERRSMIVVRDKPLQITAMLINFLQIIAVLMMGWLVSDLGSIKEYAREMTENVADIKTITSVQAVQIENVGKSLDHHMQSKAAHK